MLPELNKRVKIAIAVGVALTVLAIIIILVAVVGKKSDYSDYDKEPWAQVSTSSKMILLFGYVLLGKLCM